MGSATRAALATATEALAAQSGVTLTTGEQLLSASRAIAGSGQLRALLSDPSLSAEDRTSVLDRVFGALETPARSVLEATVSQNWSSADQLVDGIEELGIRAVAASEKSTTIEAELFAFGQAVGSDAQLELAVSSKLGDSAGKVAIVDSLFAKKASPATLAILRHLVQSARGRRIGELLRTSARIVAESSDRIVATVTAAVPLSSAQEKRLTDALAAQYGSKPHLDVVIDPSVLGGLRVQIADDVIDGSIASRLKDLRIQLAG